MLVIANGMPRSGSTVIYNIILSLGKVTVGAKGVGFFGPDDLMGMKSELLQYCRSKDTFVIKTHSLLGGSVLREQAIGNLKQVYTYRDTRSIASSLRRVWGLTDEQILKSLDCHTRISRKMKADGHVLCVKYEDFISDRKHVLSELARFLAWGHDESDIEEAVRTADELREREINSTDGLRRRWVIVASKVSGKLRLGRILKTILPYRLVMKLRYLVLLIDKDTLLHPGHVSSAPASHSDGIGDLMKEVNARYAHWQNEFGYSAIDQA